ncbi:MAG TPA: zinc-binding dehydrogenase [Patescibacteria group bacterium]|nr:zinc-binding dehydrogenase [Patescibacteria group bacterium]
MKAIVLHHHGTLDDVSYADVPEPEVGPDELLIEIKAAALNRLDLWVLEGWRGLKLQFPHIMGCDGAGVITAVGNNVNGFNLGDHVCINPTRSCGRCDYCLMGRDNLCDHFAIFGEHLPGFFAQYQAIPSRNLVMMPPEASFEVAAAASLVYVTAWHSLIEAGRFQAGEDILIIGAGGGVNTAYIDIARFAGAGKIYVISANDRKLSTARQLGADVSINRTDQNWVHQLFEATNRRGVDVVVDNVGAATYRDSLRTLKKGGRLLTVGNTSGSTINLDNRYLFGKHLQIIGSTMGTLNDYKQVMNHIFQGRLHPLIDRTYPLSGGIAALRYLEAGEVAGKLVLQP